MNRFFMNLAAALLLVLSLEAGYALSSAHLTSLTPAAGVKRVKIKKIILELPVTKLPKESNTTLTLTALYDDNSTEDVITKVEWIITPKDAVTINGRTLTAKLDTSVTIQAKLNATRSNPVTLEIYWEVNGHRLPPEPDPKINNATLLGVDMNHNGVRDDVERWIYEKYKDKHPIHIDIAMQAARGYRMVLEHPEKAKEIHGKVSAAMSCEAYYQIYAKYFNEPLLVKEDIDTNFFRNKIYFNTNERREAYDKYDTLLSGDSYTLPRLKEKKLLCDFNTSKYEE